MKQRSAKFCNLKFFLLYLVILGHWIEPYIHDLPGLLWLYRCIYLFHMPLFVFVTGLFVSDGKTCLRQCRRLLPIYLVAQAIPYFGGAESNYFTPNWYLWYIFSCCIWFLLAYVLLKFPKLLVPALPLSILAGCLVGYAEGIGEVLSLSRSLVFFPYFLAGVMLKPGIEWKKFRLPAAATLAVSVVLICLWGGLMRPEFLYHSHPFAGDEGPFFRLLCYFIGSLLSFSVLVFMPGKKFFFTRFGADTLWVYLVHGPLIILLQKLPLYPILSPSLLPLLSFVVLLLVSKLLSPRNKFEIIED